MDPGERRERKHGVESRCRRGILEKVRWMNLCRRLSWVSSLPSIESWMKTFLRNDEVRETLSDQPFTTDAGFVLHLLETSSGPLPAQVRRE